MTPLEALAVGYVKAYLEVEKANDDYEKFYRGELPGPAMERANELFARKSGAQQEATSLLAAIRSLVKAAYL